MRHDAAPEEGVELGPDETRSLGARAGLGVRDEGGRMLLRQTVRGGLLGEVAFVAERSAVRLTLSLLTDGLHATLPNWWARTVSIRTPRFNRNDRHRPK
jgi:hypothetical protein